MTAAANPIELVVSAAAVPAAGQEVRFEAADAAKPALARHLQVQAVNALEARLQLMPEAARIRIVGRVQARLQQACVVTLEPVDARIDEEIELVFAPADEAEAAARAAGFSDENADPVAVDVSGIDLDMLMNPDKLPEPIIDGRIDLGAVIIDTVLLNLDPYPRKNGAVFEPPEGMGQPISPFAALAKLKKNP
jgi:uncharacterized metal-binding protein YceD (DUF177 family)